MTTTHNISPRFDRQKSTRSRGTGCGLLWFGDIQSGIAHFVEKYGKRPNVVVAHPMSEIGRRATVQGLRVKPSNTVLPHHLLLAAE